MAIEYYADVDIDNYVYFLQDSGQILRIHWHIKDV